MSFQINNLCRWSFLASVLFFLILFSACEMPLTAPTPTMSFQQLAATSTSAASSVTLETPVQVYLPDIDRPGTETSPVALPETPANTPIGTGEAQKSDSRLAFLKNGDLWLVELPNLEPRRLTSSSDLSTFAWSPDGSRIATFNGHSLCFVNSKEAIANECLGLDLTDEQAPVPRGIVWSPDQQTIVLWNLANPWDDQALGWLVVPLDSPQDTVRIADPGEFGYTPDGDPLPGGFTGQPAFLANGTLIGTLTHRSNCGSGGCRYQLYSFDRLERKFTPYPNNPDQGWSEGQNLVLSADRGLVANFGTFISECESFITFADTFEISSGKRNAYNLELEAITSFDFSPDARRAVISRVSGCPAPAEQVTWDRSCGLSQGFDTFPLQVWDLENGSRSDLYPGNSPDWAPDHNHIAFRSCLAESQSGTYEPSAAGPPSIFVLDLDSNQLLQIGEGLYPSWSPD